MTGFEWRALARSTSGNVLPMACLGVIVLCGLVGGGVDASRAYMVKNRLQNACDSGVLAGRRAMTDSGYGEAERKQANTYFAANFDLDGHNAVNTRFVTKADDKGNQVEGTASTEMQTALMNLFGFDVVKLTATCTASMSVGNSDVMMVLDTTGSMGNALEGASQTKLQALQAAMKNFYNTVAAAKAGSNARVRFGFVPYSSSVNVGRLLYDRDPSFLVDQYTVQSRVFVEMKTVTTETCDDATDPPICTTTSREVPSWLYQPVANFPYATYKTFKSVYTKTHEASGKPADQKSTWQGCIEERATVPAATFSYSPVSGITPAEALDLNIDMPPNSYDDRTKWAPMWREVAFTRPTGVETSNTGSKAGYACPREARLLAEMTASEFNTYANALSASGNTYHDLGMIWGARLLSPTGIFSANVNLRPANGAAVSRHIIFMTDGKMEPSATNITAYGIEKHDRRVTTNGTADAKRHTSRMRAVCEATKAKGIRVWVIAFSTALTTDLSACASPDSSFTANNSTQLNAAFQDIAKEVGELRIVR